MPDDTAAANIRFCCDQLGQGFVDRPVLLVAADFLDLFARGDVAFEQDEVGHDVEQVALG